MPEIMKNTKRSWCVKYDLFYDLGESGLWEKSYRTKVGALISMFWNKHVASWGGSAVLSDNRKLKKGPT